MRNVTKFLMIFGTAAILTIACNKEGAEITPNSTLENSVLSKEEFPMTEEEREDITKTIKEIEGYKEKFDNWRQGKSTEERIDAKTASEQIEMIWNYNVSRPGTIFEKYEFVTAVAEVGDTEVKDWTGAEAAHAYEAVKEQIVKLYNGIEGGDKGINIIDMGNPSFENGKLIMYIQMNVGVGAIEDGALPKAEGRTAADIRWAAIANSTAQCIGEANNIIGTEVNQQLGYFLKNLPPFSSAPGGNTTSAKILSVIDHVQVNVKGLPEPLFGFTLPAGITISTQPLFVRSQRFDTSLENVGAIAPFTNLGKYKIHGNFTVNAPLPNEDCFVTSATTIKWLTN